MFTISYRSVHSPHQSAVSSSCCLKGRGIHPLYAENNPVHGRRRHVQQTFINSRHGRSYFLPYRRRYIARSALWVGNHLPSCISKDRFAFLEARLIHYWQYGQSDEKLPDSPHNHQSSALPLITKRRQEGSGPGSPDICESHATGG